MIYTIFIPEKIGDYYILPCRIVGIEIEKEYINATVVKYSGAKKIIEKTLKEPIEYAISLSHQDQASAAIERILEKIGTYDYLFVALSSSLIIYKELTLPFIDKQKIGMVAPFEVESMLPFSLHDAVIDTIITKHEAATATVLAIALKKEVLDEYLDIFKKIGKEPDKVTIDLIELYGLYTSIPDYMHTQGVVSLIDIGMYVTRIAIIIDGKLKVMRVLTQGIATILKILELDRNISHSEAYDYLFKSGIQEENGSKFFSQIQFTLQTSLSKLSSSQTTQKIFLTGTGTEIPHITDALAKLMSCECEVLYLHKIIHNGTIISANNGIKSESIISTATALSSKITDNFNMRVGYISETKKTLITQQLIAALLFITVTISALSLYTFFTLRAFKKETVTSEQEAVDKLKKVFSLSRRGSEKADKGLSLETANNAAKAELVKEENIWFSLSSNNRFSFLTYLQELTSRIDRDKLALDLKRLIIRTGEGTQQDSIIIEGSVKDYNALRAFEEALYESNMFKDIPKLQEPKFGTITLVLDKTDREKA
ncbi:MAG: pilus assembly protein PilM [Candidatus Babeliaceae bacterium]|jgi:Tfp pilus assembly PilM family ATPase